VRHSIPQLRVSVQAETASLLERTASQRAREWTIATPKLLTGGILAGTSGGCLATLSGIGGPPLILMYELLAVPKASDPLLYVAVILCRCFGHAVEAIKFSIGRARGQAC